MSLHHEDDDQAPEFWLGTARFDGEGVAAEQLVVRCCPGVWPEVRAYLHAESWSTVRLGGEVIAVSPPEARPCLLGLVAPPATRGMRDRWCLPTLAGQGAALADAVSAN